MHVTNYYSGETTGEGGALLPPFPQIITLVRASISSAYIAWIILISHYTITCTPGARRIQYYIYFTSIVLKSD